MQGHRAEEVCRLAHGLKGAALNLEARALGSLAAQLEEAAGASDHSTCATLLTQLQVEARRLTAVVQASTVKSV